MASSSQQHLRTAAGRGIPPEIIEVTLVYHHGWEDYELGRIYRHALPPKGDGLFLVIDTEPGVTKPTILKFEITQVCHLLIDQSHVEESKLVEHTYTISNQSMLYIVPKDDAAHRYVNALVLEAHKQRQQEQQERPVMLLPQQIAGLA